jgi:hypothetical protein
MIALVTTEPRLSASDTAGGGLDAWPGGSDGCSDVGSDVCSGSVEVWSGSLDVCSGGLEVWSAAWVSVAFPWVLLVPAGLPCLRAGVGACWCPLASGLRSGVGELRIFGSHVGNHPISAAPRWSTGLHRSRECRPGVAVIRAWLRCRASA